MGDCKTCTGCKEKKTKEKKGLSHTGESDFAVFILEKTNKRLWVLSIIAWLIVFLVIGITTYERLQYDTCSVYEEQIIEAEQDGEGINIVGGGNIEYGAESTDSYTESDTNPN